MIRSAVDRPAVEGRLPVTEDRQIRILVADSDPRVRSALQMLLAPEGQPIVVRESTDVGSLAVQVKEFKPDLVLLEWELPGRPAAALLFALHGLDAKPRVLVLSTRSSRTLDGHFSRIAAGLEGEPRRAGKALTRPIIQGIICTTLLERNLQWKAK